MEATLSDVAGSIRDLADLALRADVADEVGLQASSRLLLGCFGVRRPPCRQDTITLTPYGTPAHPSGRIVCRSRDAGGRSVVLAYGVRLILPARFSGEYKVVVLGDAVAFSLRFECRPCPAFDDRGHVDDVSAIIFAVDEITILHGAGTARLKVVS